ncbi:type I methionyl aminopeptidase [Acetobacter musti]|uniref:Methionine aminopeptidase n=1 Tax=Acetobacter musti TaxID=864732 RepID=A0ABX0JTI0_9PROT|nr:type I methionyl aminopeptidase [Acetobacter musti]NHN85338.1 type I methionyl aminopeptidase [Acetobacter musti]
MEGDTARGGVVLYDEADFVGLRAAGRLAAMTLDMISDYVRPGVTTGELDAVIHKFMTDHDSVPATLNYRGYPKSSCISLNHVVCHGIPGERVLADGDILNIDVTCILNGWYGDSSRMYTVGNVPIKARKLIDVTYDCMMAGISVVRPGATLGDIGFAIQKLAEANRFSVVRDFCGHGIGRTFHAPPNILHYGKRGEGMVLKAGMVFTIEPMINIGKPDVKILDDGWTAVTRDRSLTAQFEHMLAVTETGYEIFTLSPKGYTRPPYSEN